VDSRQIINRACGFALVALSSGALLLVLVFGLVLPQRPPPADEGTPARLFQLLVLLLAPTTLLNLATSDWRRWARAVAPLAFAVVATALAFVVLYYLEHPQ
jgi:hypothetical protein